jgi:hypothetical protein
MLPAAIEASPELLPALRRLCSMKRTVDLTPHQSETWLAALSIFETSVVNEAVVRIGLSEDPFPDLGKLVSRCDAIRRERSGTVSMSESKHLGTGAVRKIAEALRLRIT